MHSGHGVCVQRTCPIFMPARTGHVHSTHVPSLRKARGQDMHERPVARRRAVHASLHTRTGFVHCACVVHTASLHKQALRAWDLHVVGLRGQALCAWGLRAVPAHAVPSTHRPCVHASQPLCAQQHASSPTARRPVFVTSGRALLLLWAGHHRYW